MSEQAYDEQIAPLLLKIRDLCAEHQMPFIAAVQFGNEEWAHSVFMPSLDKTLANLRSMYYFAQTRNADASIGAIMKDAAKFGHSSAFIRLLEFRTS